MNIEIACNIGVLLFSKFLISEKKGENLEVIK